MNIGIDIDDTLTDTTKLANAILHNNPKYVDVLDYHDLNKEEFIQFGKKHLDEIQKYLILKDGVLEVLNNLKKQGYNIVIITARGAKNMEFLIPITEKFLKINRVPYDKIIFSQEKKGEACLKNNINIFIDDKEHVLDEIKKYNKNIKTIRFLNGMKKSKHLTIRSWFELDSILANFGVENK